MTNRKISELTELTVPAAVGDYFPIVDISEALPVNKNKRITVGEVFSSVPTGTAAAPGLSFEVDPDVGLYRSGTNQLAVSVAGAGQVFFSSALTGFGTSAPDRAVHISAADVAYLRLENRDTTGSVGQYIGAIEFEGQDAGGAGVRATIGAVYEGVSGATGLAFTTSIDAGTATEAARFTSDNYLRFAAGSLGIQFNGNTAATSALDYYDEGTFTPAIIGLTTAGTGTYTAQVGTYTRIGNRVFFQLQLIWTAHTGTGAMNVSGLPFTSNATTDNAAAISTVHSNITLTASRTLQAYVGANSTEITLAQAVVGGGTSTTVTLDTAGTLMLSGHYQTA